MATILPVLSSLTLALILSAAPSYVIADESNVLLTGGVLTTDGQLSYGGNAFVMQGDCNLVLYNKREGFQSNTHGNGVKCTLTLNAYGQLVIRGAGGSGTIWISGPPASKGRYAAVLRPDGQLVVYGPSVWSTPQLDAASGDEALESELAAGIIPVVQNVLFSSQVLYNNATLSTRDYTLVMGDGCNLELVKAGYGAKWASGSGGKGTNCFARLDHRGVLSVVDDRYRVVWASGKTGGPYGAYVLIMQINGQAVVYGPTVWSTAPTG